MKAICYLATLLALTGCAGTLTVNDGATKYYRVRNCQFAVTPPEVVCVGLNGAPIVPEHFRAARYESGISDVLQYEPTPGCCGP